MGKFTNNTMVPKAVITVDGPIILKGGETSKDVSKYKFADDYVGLLADAGVTFVASDKKESSSKAKSAKPSLTGDKKD